MPSRCRPRRHHGFGLLEAIVALALLSGLGLTVFSWINANLSVISRLRGYDTETRLRFSLTEYALTLNPARRARGEAMLDARTQVRWESRAITPMTPGAPFPGGVSTPYQLARYAVRVSASRADLEQPVTVDLVLAGHVRQTLVKETP